MKPIPEHVFIHVFILVLITLDSIYYSISNNRYLAPIFCEIKPTQQYSIVHLNKSQQKSYMAWLILHLLYAIWAM